MNKEAMEKLREVIANAPDVHMHSWTNISRTEEFCGTVGCICGWVALKMGAVTKDLKLDPTHPCVKEVAEKLECLPRNVEWEDFGKHVLGLSGPQANRLFYIGYGTTKDNHKQWPMDLEHRYNAATTPDTRRAITLERIDRFIASGGWE